MANMIARLGVTLGIDSAEFVRGIDGASKKLQQFGEAALKASAVAATALAAATIAAIRFADEITDVAKANDVTVLSVLKLREALEDNGGEAKNAGKMLSDFVRFVDQTASGSLQAQQTMTKLGVTLKEIGHLSIDELQNKFIKALSDISDPITRNALAMQVFGQAVKGVDFAQMANSISNATNVTSQQAEAIEKASDVVGTFEKAWRDLMLMLAVEVGHPLKQTISYMQSLQGETQIFGKIFEHTFKGVATLAMTAAFALDRFHDALFGDEDFIENTKQKFEELKKQISDLYRGPGLDDLSNNKNKPDGPLRDTQLPVDAEALRIAKKNADEYERFLQLIVRDIELKAKTNEQLKDRQLLQSLSLDQQKSIMQYEHDTRLIREKDKQLALDIFNIRRQQELAIHAIQIETNLTAEDRIDRIFKENDLATKSIELATHRNKLMRELEEGDTGKGFNKRMEEFFAFAPTEMQQGAQMFDSLMGNMTGALDKFVSTGKLSFKDLTRSIIQDMIRIQLRAQMISLFSSMFGMGKFTPGSPSFVGPMQPKANGGPINAGMPYLVGERGPEMIIPRSGGTVIPNNQLASNMVGQTNVTNNYINAIDVKSFEDRLLGSSNAIWAANAYANKNLATNFGRT